MKSNTLTLATKAIQLFDIEDEIIEIKPFGGGLINATFLVKTKLKNNENRKYILQKINHYIFKEVEKLMINYCNVCDYLKEVVKNNNGDISRETITVVNTKDGNSYAKDSEGNYWRVILFIPNTISCETISCSEDFYKTGKAFGKFQKMLSNYNAENLYESIPNFHNTKERLKTFIKAIEENKSGRIENVKDEIKFILDRKDEASLLVDMLERGELPLRVTHNDTKLSNILLDIDTKEGICVIDLDTIMPGLSLYDFGDGIRTGATFAKEDEVDLNKVYVDLELFEAFTKGFIEGADNGLTEKEICMLPFGAKIITLEQGIRFLTDYLDGDLYYKTSYENHNLVRTRTQLKLVQDLESKWQDINDIVKKYVKVNVL